MELKRLVEKEVCECSRVGHVRHLRVSASPGEYAFPLGGGLTGLLEGSVWFQHFAGHTIPLNAWWRLWGSGATIERYPRKCASSKRYNTPR